MQGVKIGDGAIIGTNSPIDFLTDLCWWDWGSDKITLHLKAITEGSIKDLKKLNDLIWGVIEYCLGEYIIGTFLIIF